MNKWNSALKTINIKIYYTQLWTNKYYIINKRPYNNNGGRTFHTNVHHKNNITAWSNIMYKVNKKTLKHKPM